MRKRRRQAREVYSIRWAKWSRLWWCPQYGEWAENKEAFVRLLARRLRRRWKFAHALCQLKVFGKNGRIQFERTYGRDPKRHPG